MRKVAGLLFSVVMIALFVLPQFTTLAAPTGGITNSAGYCQDDGSVHVGVAISVQDPDAVSMTASLTYILDGGSETSAGGSIGAGGTSISGGLGVSDLEPSLDTFIIRLYVNGTLVDEATVDISCGLESGDGESADEDDDDGEEIAGPPCGNLFDGRLNNRQDRDCGAPIAIYAVGDGFDVYAIDPLTGIGTLAAHIDGSEDDEPGVITQHQLLAQGINSASGQPVQVWLLTSGEIMVASAYADGKPYSIAWTVDTMAGWYHIQW